MSDADVRLNRAIGMPGWSQNRDDARYWRDRFYRLLLFWHAVAGMVHHGKRGLCRCDECKAARTGMEGLLGRKRMRAFLRDKLESARFEANRLSSKDAR